MTAKVEAVWDERKTVTVSMNIQAGGGTRYLQVAFVQRARSHGMPSPDTTVHIKGDLILTPEEWTEMKKSIDGAYKECTEKNDAR